MKKPSPFEAELSRPLSVDKISAGGVAEHIVASAIERKNLAVRFGLLDLLKLEAKLNVDPTRGKMYIVTGTMTAEVVQQCVITLEPVPAHIQDNIHILFAPPRMMEQGAGPPHLESAEEEVPEPIVNGVIDLGETIAQHLAVSLNPYPRKPGVALENVEFTIQKGKEVELNPFSKLSKPKPKPKN